MKGEITKGKEREKKILNKNITGFVTPPEIWEEAQPGSAMTQILIQW